MSLNSEDVSPDVPPGYIQQPEESQTTVVYKDDGKKIFLIDERCKCSNCVLYPGNMLPLAVYFDITDGKWHQHNKCVFRCRPFCAVCKKPHSLLGIQVPKMASDYYCSICAEKLRKELCIAHDVTA